MGSLQTWCSDSLVPNPPLRIGYETSAQSAVDRTE